MTIFGIELVTNLPVSDTTAATTCSTKAHRYLNKILRY
jgi:hypothetical protein